MSSSKSKSKSSTKGAAQPSPRSHGSITMATSEPSAATGEAIDLGQSRGICFTVYDYAPLIEQLREEMGKATYGILGHEICPKTGRPHIQGYVHYKNQRSLKSFSKKFNNCHVEAQRGTPRQASDYCKEDGKFEEFGELPVQGHRTDWEKAVKDLQDGKEVSDVIAEQPQLLPSQRALREFKAMLLKPIHRDVEVIVLVGDAGAGKSKWAYDNYPDLYQKPASDWWDGYTGQKAVLLDDFYGWIKYHDLLRVLDRYPLNVPYKGGYVWAQWDTVIITSNDMPQKWYSKGLTPALRRRLKKIIYVTRIDGGETHYETQACEASGDEA